MKEIFDTVSDTTAEITTKAYSTSFSLGIRFLGKELRQPIYNIYGFVRFADEIVDSFHTYDQRSLFNDFKKETFLAIERGISLNPVLNSFQKVVRDYGITTKMISDFLESMETDLSKKQHTVDSYNRYVFGSAEAVGLMCLKVFTGNDNDLYGKLVPYAMKLGSAFQKVNFLRDLRNDYEILGRSYFPSVDVSRISEEEKIRLENEIEEEFRLALQGIKMLPQSSGAGVYLAYLYYRALFRKIRSKPAAAILNERIRIPNEKKFRIMVESVFRYNLNWL